VTGLLTNLKNKPSPPLTLTFEFLDAQGSVVATAPQTVTSIAAGENQAFELKGQGAGIVAWRYKRS